MRSGYVADGGFGVGTERWAVDGRTGGSGPPNHRGVVCVWGETCVT